MISPTSLEPLLKLHRVRKPCFNASVKRFVLLYQEDRFFIFLELLRTYVTLEVIFHLKYIFTGIIMETEMNLKFSSLLHNEPGCVMFQKGYRQNLALKLEM